MQEVFPRLDILRTGSGTFFCGLSLFWRILVPGCRFPIRRDGISRGRFLTVDLHSVLMRCNQCLESGWRGAFIPGHIGSDRRGQDSGRKKQQPTEEDGTENAHQAQPLLGWSRRHLLLKTESASRAAHGNILVHLSIGSTGRIRSI
ncbi:hypothetical protein SAMN05216403_101188 [Nitrosospira multiformis ATCC 25196]|uniref:Uncharacterized protein n=1 Tax=Nitrosospira multiformis (strain ATCC 25196 / NCIMB 11849 / C 71) TaxID=323848 RepID=A0A1H5RT01_NITMU|nr:hypothetical protein SAMN05216411_101143 [Nitrosospira multiformis]SEF41469.1 hypothetical protein SAMN05216403_101188 [Nitrosospira multiformis ATCC 25196]